MEKPTPYTKYPRTSQIVWGNGATCGTSIHVETRYLKQEKIQKQNKTWTPSSHNVQVVEISTEVH